MRETAGGVQGVRKNITVRKPSKAVEVAPVEYVHIPRPASEAFQRPAYAYTALFPCGNREKVVATPQQEGERE